MPRWSRRPLSRRPAALWDAESVELFVARDVPLRGLQGGLFGVGQPTHAALDAPAGLLSGAPLFGCHYASLLLGGRIIDNRIRLTCRRGACRPPQPPRNSLSGRPAVRMLQLFRLSPSRLPYLDEP